MDRARARHLPAPVFAGWRRLVALLAVLGIVTLLGHELAHYVHAEAPDSCAFAYIANSVPPAPPTVVLPAPTRTNAVAWHVPAGETVFSCHDPHRSARGPPTL